MTENGDPLENAIAERVNGIIKEEYLETYQINGIDEAKELLKVVVDLYNNDRPHMSIGNLRPNQIHQSSKQIKTENIMEELLPKTNYVCKPRTGHCNTL